LYFKFLHISFLKLVVHKMIFKMIKSEMVVLSERDKADMIDVDVTIE
jgi:hypothetical protein